MIKNIGKNCSRGDIWIAKFLFYENPAQSKFRPVIIVSDNAMLERDQIMTVVPITSTNPRDRFDISLWNWKESGLDHPSCARTSKLTSLHKSFLKVKIGEMHKEDMDHALLMCRHLLT